MEYTRSLGRDREVTDTVSSGGAYPPGLRASVLELCLFSALCLASPRVFCGRITLCWILLSYLAPECGLEAGGEKLQACSQRPPPGVWGWVTVAWWRLRSLVYFSCGDTHSVFVFRAGRRAEVWAGRGREAQAACPGLCGDAGVPALNGRNVLAPAQCTPNHLPLDSPQTAWFCGNKLLR